MKKQIWIILGWIIWALLLGIFGTLLYLHYFPVHTHLSPSVYFTHNITQIDLTNYDIFYMIQSPSMLPTIPYNATVIVLPIDRVSNISLGDILAYYPPDNATKGIPVAHRVIEIRYANGVEEYLMKGDNNKFSDYWINRTEIIGKTIGILY